MSPSTEPKLYVDPVKLRLWAALGGLALLGFLLWAVPTYAAWLRIGDARTEVEVRRVLSGAR